MNAAPQPIPSQSTSTIGRRPTAAVISAGGSGTALTPTQLRGALDHPPRRGARPEVDAFRDLRTRLLATVDGTTSSPWSAPVSRRQRRQLRRPQPRRRVRLRRNQERHAGRLRPSPSRPSTRTMQIDTPRGGLIDYLREPGHRVRRHRLRHRRYRAAPDSGRHHARSRRRALLLVAHAPAAGLDPQPPPQPLRVPRRPAGSAARRTPASWPTSPTW